MRIRLYGHFEKLAGRREIVLGLENPVTLEELIRLLSLRFKEFSRFVDRATDADLSAHMAFLKEGRQLKLTDIVIDSDIVEILLPVVGG